jgi:DNA-binding response OmpR family regulator
MTVLVIEDDAVVSETLALYLGQAGYDVVTARDGATGLARATDPGVALVILDLMVPVLSGQEVCRRLRERSRVPVIMLTARAAEDDRIAGLELGADDYVTKPFSPREVVARVEALLRRTGTSLVDPNTNGPGGVAPTRIGQLEIDHWSRNVRVSGRAAGLTPAEFKVLAALARAPGRVFTREELLARAFGPDYDGMDRTVDVHITNLRRKLEAGGAPRYLHTVHGLGYRLADADAT